jgi:hypothetical protein
LPLVRYPSRFPGYAPELNPDEVVWAHVKAEPANGHADNLDERTTILCRMAAARRNRPALIRSFVTGPERPCSW